MISPGDKRLKRKIFEVLEVEPFKGESQRKGHGHKN
jgi:hypothetical protein